MDDFTICFSKNGINWSKNRLGIFVTFGYIMLTLIYILSVFKVFLNKIQLFCSEILNDLHAVLIASKIVDSCNLSYLKSALKHPFLHNIYHFLSL